MLRMTRMVLIAGVAIIAATAASAAFAYAEPAKKSGTEQWGYTMKDGQKVPVADKRVTNPDGSWREETKRGNCVRIKEYTPGVGTKTTDVCP